MPRPVLIFSNSCDGHRPLFHDLLIKGLRERGAKVCLLTPPGCREREPYADLTRRDPGVRHLPLPGPGNSRQERLLRLAALAGAVKALRPRHLILDTVDDLAPLLVLGQALGQATAGADWSAFFFRTCLHYPVLGAASHGLQNPAVYWRERARLVFLRRLARSPGLKALYCNDEFAPPFYNRILPRPVCQRIPDPVEDGFFQAAARRESARSGLGLLPDDFLFLAYGSHLPVKNTAECLDALCLLRDEGGRRAGAKLLIAGTVQDPKLKRALDSPRAEGLLRAGRLMVMDRFLGQEESADLFSAMDCLLTPYQGHLGISSSLIKACVAGRQTVFAGCNWMDLFKRRYQRGFTCRPGEAQSLARAMDLAMSAPPPPSFTDREYFRAENFQRIICRTVLG